MGQKCNPVGMRLGINKTWDSRWYADKDFSKKLKEDLKIKQYLKTRLSAASVSDIIIERMPKELVITLHTAKPGIVIGKKGSEIEKLKEELKSVFKQKIKVNIQEVKRPQTDAKLVAESVANQLEHRVNFRRAMKRAIDLAMKAGAKGIKVQVSGRVNGADMARTERYQDGSVPLQKLRADIDYALHEAYTSYGLLGVKVWICKGEKYSYLEKKQ